MAPAPWPTGWQRRTITCMCCIVPSRPASATAYLDGFNWGLDRGYGVLVEMEADGSYRPEDLPMLAERLETADMVKGSRWVRGGSVVNLDRRRELLARAGNLWIQLVMNMPVHDATGGFNLYRASVLRRVDSARSTQGLHVPVGPDPTRSEVGGQSSRCRSSSWSASPAVQARS